MRGEDRIRVKGAETISETPPRACGRLATVPPVARGQGNTPTCVGKTWLSACQTPPTRKHPHVRGEDVNGMPASVLPAETPPRAWGRLDLPRHLQISGRNTPTCVGKTIAHRAPAVSAQKHPHVRGEDAKPFLPSYLTVETPPRAWGRLRQQVSLCI